MTTYSESINFKLPKMYGTKTYNTPYGKLNRLEIDSALLEDLELNYSCQGHKSHDIAEEDEMEQYGWKQSKIYQNRKNKLIGLLERSDDEELKNHCKSLGLKPNWE